MFGAKNCTKETWVEAWATTAYLLNYAGYSIIKDVFQTKLRSERKVKCLQHFQMFETECYLLNM